MAQIIQFPERKESNLYMNMVRLIPMAESVKAVNFYAGSVESCKELIADQEYKELTEAVRRRRLELAQPEKKEPEKVEAAGVYTYTPEMGDQKPKCQMEASRGYYGSHMFIDTPLELKGRGITELDAHWCEGTQKAKEHWRSYRVTNKAYEKLKEQYSISMETLLD